MDPLRKIVSAERYSGDGHPSGTCSVIATLECGHQVGFKGSVFYRGKGKTRARCRECRQEARAA